MTKVKILTFVLLCGISAFYFHHQNENSGAEHVHGAGYAEWMSGPSSDPLSPEDALKSFDLQDGLKIETIAAEPLIHDPVAMSFDASGRMWIAEMTNYMLDVGGAGQTDPDGNIVIVEDTDNDGIADKRTVFLPNIALPRAIAHVKGGILFSDNEHLYFSANNGDKGSTPIIVDEKYAAGGNVEKKANGLVLGPDNWLYSAKSSNRYRLYPLTSDLPEYATELYRTKDWKLAKARTSGRGQWGITTDDKGRLYYTNNSVILIADTIRPNLLNRNKNFYFQGSFQNRLVDSLVYPSRPTPGVNRAYVKEILNEEGKLIKATAISGPVIYRGESMPDYYGHAIVTEPAANLITAVRLKEDDSRLTGTHYFDKEELLTSTDERFRPVNIYTGPDGGLYIVDMYRGILQDRFYITQYLVKYILEKKLDKGVHFGRIYRVSDKDSKRSVVPNLEARTSVELVESLKHINSWRRDTARRLLIERQDISVKTDLEEIILNGDDDYARLVALWTLDGLSSLTESLLTSLMDNSSNTLKSHAIRLAEQLSADEQKAFVIKLKSLSLEKTQSYELAKALAASLGQFNSDEAIDMLKTVVSNWQSQDIINMLALSGLEGQEAGFIDHFKDDKLFKTLTKLMAKKRPQRTAVTSHMAGNDLIIYNRGKGRYNGNAGCSGCHGEDGMGIEFGGPPLVGSEWVNGPADRLAALILHGMHGPVMVSGTLYQPDMEMPALKDNQNNGMADLAGIVSYLRNSWGNKSSLITIPEAQAIKTKTADREIPYTAQELIDEFGE